MTKLLERADYRMLALHQRAVDASQRGPQWWAQQCVYAVALLAILVWVLTTDRAWSDHVALGWMLFTATVVGCLAHSPLWRVMGKNSEVRRGTLVMTAVILLAYLLVAVLKPKPLTSDGVAAAVLIVAWLSVWYFAACQPPAPPKRRPATLPEGA